MDAMGGGGGALFLDGEWESLCKLFSTEQDLAFDHLLGRPRTHLPDDQGLISLLMNPISSPNPNHNSQTCSSDLSYDSNINGINNLMQPNYNEDQISSLLSFDYLLEEGLLIGQAPTAEPMECAAGDHLPSPSIKRNHSKCVDDQLESMEDEAPLPKKRARVSRHAGKRKKEIEAVEEETKARNSNADVSDDESNDSQEVINESPKEILNTNGKKRASRGAATDPQSLYARRRRERINERLRILQTLVPNGTKVDISTMLEEAVNYVKFLQLQIKLLSSDEMWMYAPLAYSGYDMGLYKSFSQYLPSQ